MHKGFHLIKLAPGKLFEYKDDNFETLISGFTTDSETTLPSGYTHFGLVCSGKIKIKYSYKNIERERELLEGDYFSIVGEAKIISNGLGMTNSAKDYIGMNIFGGPLEEKGRLLYIDGCTDSLLVPPIKKGDPCLNHLHFPKNIIQTPHTHPSVRTGLVYKGIGECVIGDSKIPLEPGYAFIIETNTGHSFNTKDGFMDVIAFHPDSDVGVTDDNHPMINRTMVDGVSATQIEEIRTKN
jgi:hypothetical protein